jgi:hypothetical protein
LYSAWIVNTAYILRALNEASRPTSLDSAEATIAFFDRCLKIIKDEDRVDDKDYIQTALLYFVASRNFSIVDHVVGGHFDNVGHDDKARKFSLIENKIAFATKTEDREILAIRDKLPHYPGNECRTPLPGFLYFPAYHVATTLPSSECGKMECCCLEEVLHAGADVEFWLEKWKKKNGQENWANGRKPHTLPSNLHRPIWIEQEGGAGDGKRQLVLHFFSTAILDWGDRTGYTAAYNQGD